jgi:hypothetical protein
MAIPCLALSALLVKPTYLIIYSITLSITNFVFSFTCSAFAREARLTIRTVVGNFPIPRFTTVGLTMVPVFYVFAAMFLGLVVASILRPRLVNALLHLFIFTLIADAVAVFVVFGGVAVFFTGLDYGMAK